VGSGPMMILWVYNTADVTRTFVETGETVPHLSPRDRAALR
jgi:HTH-type transcriptional regulator, repressor for puuD